MEDKRRYLVGAWNVTEECVTYLCDPVADIRSNNREDAYKFTVKQAIRLCNMGFHYIEVLP